MQAFSVLWSTLLCDIITIQLPQSAQSSSLVTLHPPSQSYTYTWYWMGSTAGAFMHPYLTRTCRVCSWMNSLTVLQSCCGNEFQLLQTHTNRSFRHAALQLWNKLLRSDCATYVPHCSPLSPCSNPSLDVNLILAVSWHLPFLAKTSKSLFWIDVMA